MLVETRFRKMGGRIVNMNSERPRVATNDTFMFKKGGKSGIYIKPENRGKFTASAKRAGRGVQEHARKVLADPNASPTQKKRANFARNAAKWKKEDGGDLGVFRPTEYDYLRGTQNISPLGTISREEYESFTNDTTKIPELRNTVTDASWRNVLNEFKNDPNLGGLEFADVPRPFGTGESITGRYFRDPEELQRLPIESNMGDVMRKVAPINRGNTPKTNAYNYRKGRPMNKIEMLLRKMGGKMKKYQDGGELERPDQTVAQDATLDRSVRELPIYSEQGLDLPQELIDSSINFNLSPSEKELARVQAEIAANRKYRDMRNKEVQGGYVPPSISEEEFMKNELQNYRRRGGKMTKYKCGSAMGKACGGKMRTKFSKGAKFQLGDRTMSDK